MKRMNKMLLVAALAATTLSVQAEQKKGPAWLSDALFYQIYPSSYMDTDGNGIGDLPGITSKLDYIKSLGVNALWLNPIFESGWFDGGYDIIDFYSNSDFIIHFTLIAFLCFFAKYADISVINKPGNHTAS